jgi:hypothetical protein
VFDYPTRNAAPRYLALQFFLQLSLHAHRYVFDASRVSARSDSAMEYARTEKMKNE